MQTEFNLIHFDNFAFKSSGFIILICSLALSNFRSSALISGLTSWYTLIAQWSLKKRGQAMKAQLILLPSIKIYWYGILSVVIQNTKAFKSLSYWPKKLKIQIRSLHSQHMIKSKYYIFRMAKYYFIKMLWYQITDISGSFISSMT